VQLDNAAPPELIEQLGIVPLSTSVRPTSVAQITMAQPVRSLMDLSALIIWIDEPFR